MDEIAVSVYCLVYNHEKYLRQCLDGFIMQKTNFKFEVIVHDDASTDGSADIIREYEQKYPEIIKPIYQTVNQYTQGIPITRTYILPKINGKYVAVCEGDDYWCDENKLQLQFDAMEANPDCHFCVHKVRDISADGTMMNSYHPTKTAKTGVYTPDEMFSLNYMFHGFQTSSYFMRAADYFSFHNNKPFFALDADVGDVPLSLYCIQLGVSYYEEKVMSHYRNMSEGSWSQRQKGSPEKRLLHINRMIQLFERYDEYTDKKYHDFCMTRKGYYLSLKCSMQGDRKTCRELLKPEYRYIINRYNYKEKISLYAHAYFPFLIKLFGEK